MSAPRKRYRPLDAAEERAVTAHQRLQLLPLEDDKSYCFSWPEAPLTQWLRGDLPYATLYQLIANAGGGGSSSNSSALASDVAKANLVPGLSSSLTSVTAGLHAQQLQRSVEVPPVFLLSDVKPTSRSARTLRVSDGEVAGRTGGGGELQRLLRNVRRTVEAARGTAGVAGAVTATSAPSLSGVGGALSAETVAVAERSKLPAVPRTAPHPLAPPRPQSVTEDSVLSLSATQLSDLVAAGVPALFEAAAVKSTTTPVESAEAVPSPALPLSVRTSALIMEGSDDDDDDDEGNADPARHASQHRDTSRHAAPLTEVARRAVEDEVVGLEWRTWRQSQRTAAALQRLLSLTAAVPFEATGHAPRDAWRRVVYRLWLRWRRQDVHEGWSAAALPQQQHQPHSPARVRQEGGPTGWMPWDGQVATSASPTAAPPPPTPTPTLLPWGPALLPGAYLYGTSSDYFISLPPVTTSSSGGGSGGTAASGSTAAGAATSGSASLSSSVWPAMSRRRGAYSFLRWRVELYEARLPRAGDGMAGIVADADAEAVEIDEDNDDGDEERRAGGASEAMVARQESTEGSRGARAGAAAAPVRRYAKGPLGGDVDALGTTRRGGRRTGGTAGSTPEHGSSDARPGLAPSAGRRNTATPTTPAVASQHPIHGVMSVAHIKALVNGAVLTQPLTELEMDDEPATVLERLACPDLRYDTEAWRLWLSKV